MRQEFPPTALTTEEMDIEEPARIMHHILMQGLGLARNHDRNLHRGCRGQSSRHRRGSQPRGILSTEYYLASTVGSLRRNWAGRFERQFAGITLTAVTLDPSDEADVSRDGIANNPACAGCHVHPVHGIDSVALFAECYDEAGDRIPDCEDPETEFLLEKGRGLPGLGSITAYSTEFRSQSINFFFKRLFGRYLAKEEAGYYSDAADAFEESGYKARTLIKHLVTSKEYCSQWISKIHLALLSALAVASCSGDLTPGYDDIDEGDPRHMEGAGGRDISEYWPNIEIPMSQNTRIAEL